MIFIMSSSPQPPAVGPQAMPTELCNFGFWSFYEVSSYFALYDWGAFKPLDRNWIGCNETYT